MDAEPPNSLVAAANGADGILGRQFFAIQLRRSLMRSRAL